VLVFRLRYQKTESAIKATAEKTTSLLGGIGSAMSQKIGALKNTDSFRSMEERVSSAVSSVKVNVSESPRLTTPAAAIRLLNRLSRWSAGACRKRVSFLLARTQLIKCKNKIRTRLRLTILVSKRA